MLVTCRHFELQELIDPQTYKQFGTSAWMFLNTTALQALDGLRDFFDVPVTVNNWHKGGPFQHRGFRPITCTIGGKYSQHRLGNGFDCDVQGIPAEAARERILAAKDDPRLRLITCIEARVNWVHFDCRNIADRIRIVTP